MLTDHEEDGLRQRVQDGHRRRRFRGPTQQIVLKGGPLDGLKPIVLQREAQNLYLGWAVVTDRGPVQALYRLEGPGAFGFAELVVSVDWSKGSP